MTNKYNIWSILVLAVMTYKTAEAQDIWKEVDALNYVLTFYDQRAKDYDDAKNICNGIEVTLVQLNDNFVLDVINSTIRDATSNFFWVGAERDDSYDCPIGSASINCIWNWSDGSSIDMMSISWYENQPDNFGDAENRMIIRKTDSKSGDIPFTFAYAGTICRKRKGPDDPWIFDTQKYRLSFYDKVASDWNGAIETCGKKENLVILVDEEVRTAVYGIIGRAVNVHHFWIGAEGGKNDWEWVDGTEVDMNIIEWYSPSPDDNGRKNKLVIRKVDNKFGDVQKDYALAGIICQVTLDCYNFPRLCVNGKCQDTNADGFHECICHQGYYGNICEDEYCDAHDNPCCNGGTCISNHDGEPYYTCNCRQGYYGNICKDEYCDAHENPCCNGGTCISNHDGEPYYTCNCRQGYYGNICKDEYCDVKDNPCKNGGSCISYPIESPFYKCNCTGLGYGGSICDQELIQINSENEAIGIVGNTANINIEVTTLQLTISIDAYKNNVDGTPLQTKTDITGGTVTFTFYINSTQDEGNYIFSAYPASKEYSRTTSTNLIVHVNATITNLSRSSIFSPVTNGSSEVECEVNGIPLPSVTWYNANNESVPSNDKNGVYQTTNTKIAILHVENAVQSDDGNYTCKAVNEVGADSVSVSDQKVLRLAVYGSPTILKVESTKCSENGNISIEWKPNNQTTKVLHRFEIRSLNATVSENKRKSEKAGKIVSFDGLQPYTEYNILIEVCPDLCITELNASDVQTTGHGLPGTVKNALVERNEDSNVCNVYWENPNTPIDQIIDYNVISEAKLVYVPPDADEAVTEKEENILDAKSELIHKQETKPNTEYKFSIKARTCAGFGGNITATGFCITKNSAPSEVPDPIIDATADAGPTRQVTIPLASETNGPISCSFVIVNRGNNIGMNKTFSLQQLRDAEEAALAGNTDADYLAIAIPRENMTSAGYEANIGDETESTCDVSNIFTSERNAESNSYSGKNLALATGGAEYGFYVVTATPVDGAEALLKSSEVQIFTNGIADSPSVVGAAVGGAIGGLLVIVLVVGGIYMWRRHNTQKQLDEVFDSPPTPTTDKENVNPQFVEDEPELEYEGVVAHIPNSDTDIPFRLLKQKYIDLKANESKLFREEYQKLKAKSKASAPPATYGGSERFMSKNRYKNILPYDCTRVHLGRDEEQDYINACYVTGYNKNFIATQGPLSNTVIEFWKMVVEQRCEVIVMLTKCNEAGRMKCEQYWPELNQTMKYGDINVRNKAENYFGGYAVRTMESTSSYNEKLTVIQFQFVKWPDHGIPKTTSSFFRFHKAVMQAYGLINGAAPLLVHCSAGVGRTGTFIGYDILQDETIHQKKAGVDIFNCVLNMRQERVDMVQTCDQYELLHKLLLERYLFGETDVNESEINENKERARSSILRDKFEKEFQNLSRAESLKCKSKEDPYHIPDPRDRVVIVRQPDDTEFISFDATYLEAYDKSTRLIAVRSPLNSTVEYFLRAILDNNIDTIVMLDKPGRKNPTECVQYWPKSSHEPLHVTNITVSLQNQKINQRMSERTLIVSRNNQQTKVVTQFEYSSWSTQITKQNSREILDLVSTVQAHTQSRNSSVVMVHCSDGLGKSGSFCALINILERLKKEGQVDVFRAVKDLRDLKSGMVQTLDQYKFCYEVVQSQLSTENIYANAVFESEEPQDPVYENIQRN